MGKKKRLKAQRSKHSIQEKTDAPKGPTYSSKHVSDILKWLFLALIVFLIYSSTLGSPFLFDDVQFIPDNRNIRLTTLDIDGITRAAFDGPSSYRPVAKISFALNYYFHRYNVFGYHLVNILIHITTGILLYLFVQMSLGLLSRPGGVQAHSAQYDSDPGQGLVYSPYAIGSRR